MNILSHLNPNITVAVSAPASTKKQIQDLLECSPIPIPSDYLEIIRQVGDMELLVNLPNDEQWYLRLWGAATCLEMNETLEVQIYLAEALAIGTDEGGSVLVLVPHASPPGLYRVGMGSMALSDAHYLCTTLTELLVHGKNIALVFKEPDE
jgi:hypothetical protein